MRKVERKRTREYSHTEGSDIGLPDAIVEIEGIGPCHVRHANAISIGYVPRDNSDKCVAVMITIPNNDGGEIKGYSLMHMLGKEEAFHVAVSIMRVAEEGDNLVDP